MLGKGHDTSNDWCRFPISKCICTKVGYKRLSEGDEGWFEASANEEDPDNPNPSTSGTVEMAEELLFYNDNQSYQSVVVEKNLCASDLCQLLAMKNRVTKSKHWCIFECWNDLGLERLVEDHEYVFTAYRDMKGFSLHSNLQYRFRKDFRKYEFFHHPDQFFPQNMVNVEEGKSNKPEKSSDIKVSPSQCMMLEEYQCPVLYSHIWVRDERKRTWSKSFLIIRGHKLYLTPKLSMVNKFMKAPTREQALELISNSPIPNHLRLFGDYICEYADLNAYYAYTTLNAKNQFRAPTEWGIVLRPATKPTNTAAAKGDSPSAKTTPSSGGVESDDVSTASSTDLRCLACESEKVRSCWVTAMRLAKYGKQLRENYRAFRNKQGENVSKDYSSYSVPNVSEDESVRSRVAMDFTGPVGRIVEDPQEAHAIATAEGYAWQRRWRGGGVRPATSTAPLPDGVHCAQPWFHRGMSRERATEVVNKHGTVNGVFLVRDSRSNPGSFVITYKFNGKVLHAQVNPIMDPLKERAVLSLDNGTTKFYDLLQLVEFYQLNAGCLPTRLTHYVSFALTEDEDISTSQIRNAEKSNN